MAGLVFALCAITSLLCAVLLWRGYRRSGARLLLWSSLCFTGFFVNNLMLVLDMTVFPSTDLLFARQLPAILGVAALVYGLVWDGDD